MTSNQPIEQQPPRRKRVHLLWAITAVAMLFIGVGIGGTGDTTTPAASESPAPTVTVTAEPEIVDTDPSEETLAEIAEREAALDDRAAKLDKRKKKLDKREADISDAEVAVEKGTIPGTGIYLVGDDIQPGTYRGDGSSEYCYWARLLGTSGSLDDIIANGNPGGPTVVTISESDVAFETTECADWVRQ